MIKKKKLSNKVYLDDDEEDLSSEYLMEAKLHKN